MCVLLSKLIGSSDDVVPEGGRKAFQAHGTCNIAVCNQKHRFLKGSPSNGGFTLMFSDPPQPIDSESSGS